MHIELHERKMRGGTPLFDVILLGAEKQSPFLIGTYSSRARANAVIVAIKRFAEVSNG